MKKRILTLSFFLTVIFSLSFAFFKAENLFGGSRFHLNTAHERLLLVTGCPRSGTHYIAALLTKAGLPVGHEAISDGGTASWVMAVSAKTAPWGPKDRSFKYDHIFHQVREPTKSIAAIETEPANSWRFICEQIPEISLKDSSFVRACKMWLYWNLRAEEMAEWTFRIEDIDDVFDEFQERLGVTLDRAALENVSRDKNHRDRKKEEYAWDEIQTRLKKAGEEALFEDIRNLAARYGYLKD
jgi:hypothetical protein